MSIEAGTRLGPYEIVSPIGAGGMGEVWRARDTRLDRSVAVKILPAELANNAQLKIRFEREARAISQLSHPHICTLFDVGDGYLVMELLEGESLADRLPRGPLPISEVFRLGAQIAGALDKAHRAGIVHRDLKPGNVMLTKNGAKLLDFGLAKSVVATIDVSGATEHRPLTQEGTIIGTFQYMAPEQLEGIEADARTDIFALGALLYEMATGKRAFQGSSKTSLIASIVGGQPRSLAEVLPASPSSLEHIIARCLEKDPDERWQSAKDVAQELLWASEREAVAAASPAAPGRRRALGAMLAASWVLIAAAVAWFVTRPAPPMTVTSLAAPAGFAVQDAVMISPDGRHVAFVAVDGKQALRLFVRDLSETTARPLPGTENGLYPFWSPDSRSIGFFANQRLKTISVDGGPAQDVADVLDSRGGTWTRDGTIIFNHDFRDGLFSVPAEGGKPVRLTRLAAGEISHRWPVALPDGKHVLFLAQRAEGGATTDPSTIDVVTTDGGERRALVRANSSPLYSTSGHLLFWRAGSMLAQRFDADSLKVSGAVSVVVENVAYSATEAMIASVSDNGTLVCQTAVGDEAQVHALLSDRNGTTSPINGLADGRNLGAALSHDGGRLAYSARGQGDDLRVFDLTRATTTRLTLGAGDEVSPVWSPDDKRIAFSSDRGDGPDVYVIAATGGEPEQPLVVTPEPVFPNDWSSDGSSLLLTRLDPKTGPDLWTYTFADKRAVPLIQTPFAESQAVFSPDGKWIAFTSDQSGRDEIHVSSREGRGSRWQVSKNGGEQASWRRDGKELFFLSPAHELVVVTVTGGDDLSFSEPVTQFTFREPVRERRLRTYSVAPDGQRFVILTASATSGNPVTMVQNWTALLKPKSR
jgi:Tol biopolymer transport system component